MMQSEWLLVLQHSVSNYQCQSEIFSVA